MTSEPLSPLHPQYCMLCGASLTYTKISTVAGQGSVSWKCSGCGEEDTDNWFDFTPCDGTDQSPPESDIEFTPFLPDYGSILPPPLPPPPSYFVTPEDARTVQEQLKREFREHGRRYENGGFSRRVEADDIVALVRGAHFPLFAVNDLQRRFPFQSYGWGSGRSKGETSRMVTSFSLTYAGPSYPNVTERVAIEQEDKESRPGAHVIADELHIFDARRIVLFLASLPEGEEPDMQALWEGKAIYQYVNVASARRAPVERASIQLQSGEVASWTMRRFDAPLPIAHARAQIEGAVIDVGAIGPAAKEIENLLGQLTRLTPESAALDQLRLGLKAWDEYFRRRFQA